MNAHRWFLALTIMIGCVHASLAQIDPATLSKNLDEGKFESLQQVRVTDADAVLPVIRGYVIGKQEAVSEPALEAISKVPNLVQWVGQDLQKRIALGRLDFTVDEDFELLGRLRSPEAVREIGRHINNDAILKSPSDDLGSQVVSVSAGLSLCLVGFKNAPTPNLWRSGGLARSEVESWQMWWKENHGRIDELVKEANNSPPPPPGKRRPTTSKAMAMPQSTPSTPRTSATAKPTASAEKPVSTGFPIVPMVILAVVIAGTAVFLLRRKSP